MKKVWVLDYQYSDVSKEIKKEIKEIAEQWEMRQSSYLPISIDLLEENEGTPHLIQYLKDNNIPTDEDVLVCYWW